MRYHDPYIGCVNDDFLPVTKHYRGSIQGHTMIDFEFLEALFNKDILPPTEECGVIESLRTRRKYCGKYLRTTFLAVTNQLPFRP